MLSWDNKLRSFAITVTAFFGLSAALIAIYEGISKGKLTSTCTILIICFIAFVTPKIIIFILSLKFRKINEEKFIKSINWNKVDRITAIVHTGKTLFTEIYKAIGKHNTSPQINIVARTRLIESMDRHEYIKSTTTNILKLRENAKIKPKLQGNEKIDIRFYEAIPSLRGITIEDIKGNRISYISSYYWKTSNDSKAFEYSFILKDSISKPREQTELITSWFNQYWGNDEIHTIIFDFDDTLIPTMDIQIQGWIETIDEKIKNNPKYLTKLKQPLKKYKEEHDDNNFREEIKNIFIKHQLAEVIIGEIFTKLNNDELTDINKIRFARRRQLLQNVEPFPGVSEKLEELHKYHNFAIITSTDERMVRSYLSENGLLKYFSVILGKNDPGLRYERENIYKKTSLILKLSGIIGVPLNRMIYIGDNNSDYLATRQIGLDFIEAKQAAINIGQKTLLQKSDLKGKMPIGSFDSFFTDDLNNIIKTRSKERRKSKYEFNDNS